MAPGGIPAGLIGDVLLWLAALLTAVTGFDYLLVGLQHIGNVGSKTAGESSGR